MSDIGYRPIEFAECSFDFSVEKTNVPSLSCQRSHCLFFWVFFVTLGQHIRRSLFDPVTGCSSTTRSYIPLINTARAVFFQTALHSTGH